MDFISESLKKFRDEKGFLTELLQGRESDKRFVRFFYATIKPDEIRGNHYHRILNEWLVVITGKVRLIVEDIFTKERREIILSPSKEAIPKIYIGVNVAHIVKNITKKEAAIIGYMVGRNNLKARNALEYKRYDLLK